MLPLPELHIWTHSQFTHTCSHTNSDVHQHNATYIHIQVDGVMLFATTPNDVNPSTPSPHPPLTHPSSPLLLSAAKVRRLYDIANVLVSMGLIAKDSYINTSGGYHKPGFYWVGPDITDVSHIRELELSVVQHVHTAQPIVCFSHGHPTLNTYTYLITARCLFV